MKKVPALIAALAVAGGLSFAAAPAYAAGTLPDTDLLFAITCDNDPAAFFSVDPATAVGTLIGTDTTVPGDCGGPAAFDPTTGKSYYISWGATGQLALMDVATGKAIAIGGFAGGNSPYPDSIAIGNDGKAFVISGDQLYSLDLSTAMLTTVGQLADTCLYGFAVDPTTGTYYAVQCDDGTVYTVDVGTATLAPFGVIDDVDANNDGDQEIYALQIDSAGVWWIESDGDNNESHIWSLAAPAPTSSSAPSGIFSVGGAVLYTESLLITRSNIVVKPALADTGRNASVDGTLVAGTSVLLLSGIGMLFIARRRRSAAN